MGQFPRKCKLRGPSRVTSRYPVGTLYISPGPNCENPAKIRQIWAKSTENLSNLKNFAKKLATISAIFKKLLSIENGAKDRL